MAAQLVDALGLYAFHNSLGAPVVGAEVVNISVTQRSTANALGDGNGSTIGIDKFCFPGVKGEFGTESLRL